MAEVGLEVIRVGDILKGLAEQFIGGVAEQPADGLIDLEPAAFGGDEGHADGRMREGIGEALLAQAKGHHLPAQLQVRHDLARENFQGLLLCFGKLSRYLVDHAEGAEGRIFRRGERCPGIKPNFGSVCDQRIFREPAVLRRIGNDKEMMLLQGVGTKRHAARSLADLETHLGLEPLPPFVDEGNQRNRSSTNIRRHGGKVVEGLLGKRIQDGILLQRLQPSRFLGKFLQSCHSCIRFTSS
jgi:hypothetical protein